MNEKVAAPEPTAALEVSEPLGYGGGSPVTGPDDFKDNEEPKEKTAGAPTAEGKEKVEVGAAGSEGGTETGAAAADDSGFCGPGKVGVVGVLPAMRKWGRGEKDLAGSRRLERKGPALKDRETRSRSCVHVPGWRQTPGVRPQDPGARTRGGPQAD